MPPSASSFEGSEPLLHAYSKSGAKVRVSRHSRRVPFLLAKCLCLHRSPRSFALLSLVAALLLAICCFLLLLSKDPKEDEMPSTLTLDELKRRLAPLDMRIVDWEASVLLFRRRAAYLERKTPPVSSRDSNRRKERVTRFTSDLS